MKTQFVIFLLLFSFIPQPTTAVGDCTHRSDRSRTTIVNFVCYDPKININVGSNLIWEVDFNEENQVAIDYGIASNHPLKIKINVIKDFRGLDSVDVSIDWDKYFQTLFTVDKLPVDEEFLVDTLDIMSYKLILPTMAADGINYETLFPSEDYVTEKASHFTTFRDTEEWQNVTIAQSLIDGVYYQYEEIEKNIEVDESYAKTSKLTEISINTNNGIILEKLYIFQNEKENYERSYKFHYLPDESTLIAELSLPIDLPFPLFVVFAIAIVALVVLLIYRKNGL